ncbi:MAG: methionyl-tRNA formyltransferase [Steroidobacteraceae bacterium]|nr:methionyl-tRNA formyltransferase [Steroidobacteraceae bacterium]
MKLAFAGTPSFAVPALEALRRAGHEIRAVFTQADRPAGRGREPQASPVKLRALELALRVHQPTSFKSAEALDLLRDADVDAFIVVAYGLILPTAALGLPRLGCLNIHASLLPRWRGAAPIQRAILAGDAVTGVSIMHLEPGLDTGPVFATQSVPIGARDTAQSLGERLAMLGANMIGDTLTGLALGTAVATPQLTQGVSYAAKLGKVEATIDWRADAVQIERQVRAFNPWPIAQTFYNGEPLRLWEAALVSELEADNSAQAAPGTIIGTDHGIDVACGRGALRINKLQRPGRKVIDARSFLNATALTGARFGAP